MPSEESHGNMLDDLNQGFYTRAIYAGRDPSYASTPVHVAVGLEHADDIIADLDQALNKTFMIV
tara:strand:+ start:522 stop:713 length:192 start_codon:yes stop_codon:yes gene_type:complete